MVEYSNYIDTLSQTSIDTTREDENENPEVMTLSQEKVINFDNFSLDYIKQFNPGAQKTESVDAFCKLNGKYCLIEFKNGSVQGKKIRYKILGSIALILYKDDLSPEVFKNNSLFILVYNKNAPSGGISEKGYENFHEKEYLLPSEINFSNNKDQIFNFIGAKANTPTIRFGLEMYKGLFFSQVMTMDKEIFEEYIKDKTITIPEN